MDRILIGVGNAEAQERFFHEYKPFLSEHEHLQELMQAVFIRKLQDPVEEESDTAGGLPAAAPHRIALDDRVLASRVIFYLGRAAADDFSELLILAGNGYGIGAYKILRGLYEKVVTATYVAKNPSEAKVFAEDHAVKRWRLVSALQEADPSLLQMIPEEDLSRMKVESDTVRQRRKDSVCPRCRQPKTQEAWIRADMLTMARAADANLAKLYGPCYLEPTFHTHPTAFGLSFRIRETELALQFKESSPKEARSALMWGHNLILYVLKLNDDYFELGLSGSLQARFSGFMRAWNMQHA